MDEMKRLAWDLRKACLRLRQAALELELQLQEIDKQLGIITPLKPPGKLVVVPRVVSCGVCGWRGEDNDQVQCPICAAPYDARRGEFWEVES